MFFQCESLKSERNKYIDKIIQHNWSRVILRKKAGALDESALTGVCGTELATLLVTSRLCKGQTGFLRKKNCSFITALICV